MWSRYRLLHGPPCLLIGWICSYDNLWMSLTHVWRTSSGRSNSMWTTFRFETGAEKLLSKFYLPTFSMRTNLVRRSLAVPCARVCVWIPLCCVCACVHNKWAVKKSSKFNIHCDWLVLHWYTVALMQIIWSMLCLRPVGANFTPGVK